MRDEIICCIIVILLSGLFFLNGYVVRDNTQSIVKAIESAESDSNSYQKILDKWEKEKKALFYFCSHGIIAEIDENITLGCGYMKDGDAKRAECMYKKAAHVLKDLAQREKIKLDNIF